MDWKQKAQALLALSGQFNFYLLPREDGSWYVQHSGIEREEGGFLAGSFQHEDTPEEAIDRCWEWATDTRFYLVKNAWSRERKAYKWIGFMWKEIEEKKSTKGENL